MKNIKKIIFAFVLFFSAYNLFSQENIRDFLETINSGNYVIDFYCDVLKSGNRDTLHKFSDIYVDREFPDPDYGVWKSKWYDKDCFYFETIDIRIDNYTSDIDDTFFKIAYHGIYPQSFKRGEYIDISFKLSPNSSLFDEESSLNWKLINQKELNTFYFFFDGDYLFIYLNGKNKNNLFATFVNINDETFNEFKNLVTNNTCDLSKVTWPRHADGTCDYDDNSKSTKTAVSSTSTIPAASTNVTVNKNMLVTENLKLRSGEATSTQVLAVMSAGTKMKILQLGKAETIDGINSNWVKVEVQKGAKDRNGKEIKAGTVGWCYGGYLK